MHKLYTVNLYTLRIDYIAKVLYNINVIKRKAVTKMTLKECINTLNEHIPAPDNKMVDAQHLEICVAWQELKLYINKLVENQNH